MTMDYTWKISNPLEQLSVNIWNHVSGRLDFEAHMVLRSEALNAKNLILRWVKDPWITLKVLLGIYWHAGVLYFAKKVTFYDHPRLKP